MSTAQCIRQREKTGTWNQVFPNEQVSAQQSTVFVKKLLAVAISSITYLRAIFPEHAFGDRCLEDLSLKILKDDSPCSGACQVIKWVKGCFDALERKYLRMLVIGIYTDPENPDTVIESYTFKFSYAEDVGVDIYRNKEKISSAQSAQETKRATIRLLRTIVILTQSLHSLPDDVFMTMKLHYFDDITPPEYQPPGFQQAATESFNFDEDPMNIKVGDVITPFHTVKLRIKTDRKQFENPEGPSQPEEVSEQQIQENTAEDPILENEDEPMESVNDINREASSDVKVAAEPTASQVSNKNGLQIVPEPGPTEGDSVPVQSSPNAPDSDMRAVSTTGSQMISQQSQEDYRVLCGCGYNQDDGLMIICAYCKTWQHGVCYKVIDENLAPLRHICDRCASPEDPELQPTDPKLHEFTAIAKEATCLWRRALFVCQETTKIMVPNLAKRLGIETTVAHGLVSRLEKEGFIKGGRNKRHGKLVDKAALERGFKKYLTPNTDDNSNLPDITTSQKLVVEKKNRVNNEIDRITARAENLNLAGERKPTPKDDQSQPTNSQPPTEQPRGKKRVKPMSGDGEYDFEVSNSQEMTQGQHQVAKKRKSSIATKAIRV